MQNLISIIMPVYNAEKYVGEAINSVLNQTYLNWELLVVNDGSTDKSVQVIQDYMKTDTRIKFINKKNNEGIASARNSGIKEAEGDYICFLDSDDMWKVTKLEEQLNIMKENSASFSCTSYSIIDEQHNKIGYFRRDQKFYSYEELLHTNFIGCLTVMITSQLMKKNPMPSIKHEDYATWLNILSRNKKVFFIDQHLAIYRKTSGSISSNKFKTIGWTWKIFASQNKLSKFQRVVFFIRYMYYTINKYVNFKRF
ncbi:glycosyltransferase family 2 protein [Vagococcus acidifermentans]|uniref:Glycosyltransferase 2-like domain-containing protein n=1 Tax=Vagococcus acidifermentans TaxID=564710 RepID=A0A430ATT3_9ENTE|nr:glycosyltransferase family 2 protein [Vagococcus acidifermentans]RSU11472.1 hypothetical protein CBF27_08220 [Vagococcus acidifermentans]